MSWQSYVDNSLLGSSHIDKCAIFPKEGYNIWAMSLGFKATPDEIQSILKGFSDASFLNSNGIYLDGQKYLVVTANERTIYGRKALISAQSPEGVEQEKATATVEGLRDYLIGMGY
ncbi:profilin [Aspergillus transmontanensis]|uniref:Profilin n=1 Tax=Aspergillus transmontanensis TaxID=1034304 RepID=A0A5N6W6L2_9EURO|nr:profilin [Aspergillus transmontanensis]